ncbi:spindle-body formation-associated [Pyrenophora seminiperda CCB06]|uniref:Spindle-body formation-associated n=1 Tax=Pyrenophora seminiperda CCB06 TaxID=1302712 RepID=A0A3M7MFK2_9PLEO|nr:spindle-body formation-associated [Pyrenophora seminiperda CCB06]
MFSLVRRIQVRTYEGLLTPPENNYESTFIEPPETPAHQFAVKAFKQAIFGTPAPEETKDAVKKSERKARIDAANAKAFELPAPRENGPPVSPSKQPGGILMTPGTASKGRKQVSFGSQVVDNEGKRGNIGKTGIPNDCPGKFPSPWTPGTQLKLDAESEKRPRTRLTEALLDARTTTQPKSGQKPKARDDSDITIDLGAPRSESGKYWKEQYESYADKSEKEMKKVITKQQLAKKFAMKKDGEVTELANKLEQERKRYRQREKDLEEQNKDLQERLRQAMAESMSSSIEIAALKARVAVLEGSTSLPSSDLSKSKASFDIYEDASRDHPRPATHGLDIDAEMSYSMASSTKENSSPKPRRQRRGTIPDTLSRPILPSRLGAAEGEASVILGKSPRAVQQEQPPKSPLKIRRPEPSKENNAPRAPAEILPSSPLPMPSPGIDPWMEMNNSSIAQMDKMAMPISTGQPYTRPEWNPPPRQHRMSKSVSQAKQSETSRQQEKATVPEKSEKKTDPSRRRERTSEKATYAAELGATSMISKKDGKYSPSAPKVELQKTSNVTSHHSPTDPKFDLSKVATHHAEGSAEVKEDRSKLAPIDRTIDRKEQARRRLADRRKVRKNPSIVV